MVTGGEITQCQTNPARTFAGRKLRTLQVPGGVSGQGNGMQGSK